LITSGGFLITSGGFLITFLLLCKSGLKAIKN
jgi:hypothetical protein